MSKVLVTGFTGCIGAATVQYLLDQGIDQLIGFSRSANVERIPAALHSRIECVRGDIASWSDVRQIIQHHRPTHVIHLSAFQTPDCQAQPFRGMEINVGGTANLLRALAEVGSAKRVVLASSAAVYGPRAIYAGPRVDEGVPFMPAHLYGYWKVCGEGMAQAFHLETQVPTVSLRIATTYGPGRDQGMTSAPTTAIKAVALGAEFEVPYDGGEHYHYVHDVAAGFGEAALAPFTGCAVFNTRGVTASASQFLGLLKQEASRQGLAHQCRVTIARNATHFPFACDLDDAAAVRQFPKMPLTSLTDGIRESLEYFRHMVAQGQLRVESLPS